MKSKFAWFWFIVSLMLGALLLVQVRVEKKQRQSLESLQLQVENIHGQTEGRLKELEQDRQKLRGELKATENELKSTRLAYSGLVQMTNAASVNVLAGAGFTGNSPAAPPSMQSLLGKMFNDPETRKAMEQQQRLALDMIYGSLVKELQLSPDQERKFKDILLDQQMASVSQAGSLFDQNSQNRAEIAQKLGEDREKRDQQLKDLIGEDKFARYQDYNQTVGERMMLDQYGKQLELAPDQTDQLLNIMREEKKNAQINVGAVPGDASKDWQTLFQDNGAAEQLFSQQAQVNQRVLERAGQVLTPEQLQKLGPVLENQLTMQKAGMKMARQMFGNQPNTGAASQTIVPPAQQ
jgi:hypothetical protein